MYLCFIAVDDVGGQQVIPIRQLHTMSGVVKHRFILGLDAAVKHANGGQGLLFIGIGGQ